MRKLGAGAAMAALWQGGKELGAALKAFPDSISIDEPGTVLNPTQGEIAEMNRGGSLFGRVANARERAAAEPARDPPEREPDRE